jgi:hypothetical protein
VDPVTASSINGGNFNRYWYANSNPYKFTDPDGRYARGQGDVPFGGGPVRHSGSCALAEACLGDSAEASRNYDGSGEEENFVRTVAGKFSGQEFEHCALVCKGANGYELSAIKTDGSHIGCDTSTLSCPSGTTAKSDIHGHPKEGKVTLNAVDVKYRQKGRVGQTIHFRSDEARNFSEIDRRVNRESSLNGWLIPFESDGDFLFYNYRSGDIERHDP